MSPVCGWTAKVQIRTYRYIAFPKTLRAWSREMQRALWGREMCWEKRTQRGAVKLRYLGELTRCSPHLCSNSWNFCPRRNFEISKLLLSQNKNKELKFMSFFKTWIFQHHHTHFCSKKYENKFTEALHYLPYYFAT